MSKKGHRKRQQEPKVHKNKWAKFSHADEKFKQQEALSERLRKQAEEAERGRQRDSFSYTFGYGGSSLGSRNWYSSFAEYTLRELEPNFHLPYERYQPKSALDFI